MIRNNLDGYSCFWQYWIDLTTYAPTPPRLGEKPQGSAYITVPGGEDFNRAVAAAGLGLEARLPTNWLLL
ncbi:MAG: hypothetical protein J7L66_01120 [Anaerolineaceae bacterium]|nr:hypothetical protein [Anaerolineaceae bacterium]